MQELAWRGAAAGVAAGIALVLPAMVLQAAEALGLILVAALLVLERGEGVVGAAAAPVVHGSPARPRERAVGQALVRLLQRLPDLLGRVEVDAARRGARGRQRERNREGDDDQGDGEWGALGHAPSLTR